MHNKKVSIFLRVIGMSQRQTIVFYILWLRRINPHLLAQDFYPCHWWRGFLFRNQFLILKCLFQNKKYWCSFQKYILFCNHFILKFLEREFEIGVPPFRNKLWARRYHKNSGHIWSEWFWKFVYNKGDDLIFVNIRQYLYHKDHSY